MTNQTLLFSLALTACFTPATANAADPADTIIKLNKAQNYETAARKCEKYGAAQPQQDSRLREACAQAEWDYARRQNTLTAWSNFRKRWTGTSYEPRALEQEGQKALIMLGIKGTEEEFDVLAAKYASTAAGETAKLKAAFAAFRGVNNPEDAFRVVGKYPRHEGAAELTMKYLEGFVNVAFTGDKFTVELDEAAVVADGQAISSNWVSRGAGSGGYSSWGDDARRQLMAAGLSEAFVAGIPVQADPDAPSLPLCFNPDAPDGWEAGVMVRLGRGSAFVAAPWDDRCSDKTWPVFLNLVNEQVVGLSLHPHHQLSMPHEIGPGKSFPWGDPDAPTKMYLPFAPGVPVMFNGMVAQPLGTTVYLVQPMTGGMPWWWLTSKTPPGNLLKLDANLVASKLWGDWKVAENGPGSKVLSASLGKDEWNLPGGAVRPLSPLFQHVTGLEYEASEDPTEALPGPVTAAWTLPPRPVITEVVDPPDKKKEPPPEVAYGPPGASPGMMELLEEDDLLAAVEPLSRAGIGVEALRGWKLSLDDDGAAEVLVEGVADGVGVRFLLDRPDRGITRVFAFDTGPEAAMRSGTSVPFTFVRGNKAYLAVIQPKGSGATISALHFGPMSFERERFNVGSWSAP